MTKLKGKEIYKLQVIRLQDWHRIKVFLYAITQIQLWVQFV